MRTERVRAWRGVLTLAATYVAFLLFAQFGFLAQLQRDLGDAGLVRAAMAAMWLSGLAASLGTAAWLGRLPGLRLVRVGLGAVAAVAALSVVCHGLPSLLAVAAATGASIGLLTVAVAAELPRMVPPRVQGVAVGLATGAAYFVSNLPFLFAATPALRALVPAALALAALAFAPTGSPHAPGTPEPEESPARGGLLRLLITFLVLIWLDSAAFAIVQASPELKARTWGSAGQQILQGSIHLLAAAGAGALLDAGFALAVPLAAWGLFAIAFPLLQGNGAGSMLAGPLYAIGISFYSTALVVAPSWRGGAVPPRWRAGLLFGVAGWIGSALGVGMAQDLGRIPAWFLAVTGAALAVTWLSPSPRSLLRLYGPTLGIALAVVLLSVHRPADQAAASIARGRRVYVEEGCIHCHSQYVRPGTRDEVLWGPGRSYDRAERPPLIAARGPTSSRSATGGTRSGRRLTCAIHGFSARGRACPPTPTCSPGVENVGRTWSPISARSAPAPWRSARPAPGGNRSIRPPIRRRRNAGPPCSPPGAPPATAAPGAATAGWPRSCPTAWPTSAAPGPGPPPAGPEWRSPTRISPGSSATGSPPARCRATNGSPTSSSAT
jgi:hypothetical protein